MGFLRNGLIQAFLEKAQIVDGAGHAEPENPGRPQIRKNTASLKRERKRSALGCRFDQRFLDGTLIIGSQICHEFQGDMNLIRLDPSERKAHFPEILLNSLNEIEQAFRKVDGDKRSDAHLQETGSVNCGSPR
jgi:hypothetical protein